MSSTQFYKLELWPSLNCHHSVLLYLFFLLFALFFNLLLSLPNPDVCVCVSIGLPGGLARSTHSSSSSDIKREDKEDDDNLSDKTDDEKKDHKAARNRAR